MGFTLTFAGAWAQASRITQTMAAKFERATDRAVMKEAHRLRGLIIRNVTGGGGPSGAPFAPLAPSTIVMRMFKFRFGGTKPLTHTAALRNSISVVKLGKSVFVGVLRKASKKGVNIAELMEFGSKQYTIKMSPKMRRFLMKAFRNAGLVSSGSKGSKGGGVLVIRIPARPFVGPTVDKEAKPADVQKRFWDNVSKEMNGDLGTP